MRICLSSVETARENAQSVCEERAPSLLTSFLYARHFCRNLSTPRGKWWLGALRQAKFRMVDSGAYTIRTAEIRGNYVSAIANGVDYDKYLHDYIAWLKWAAPYKLADVWVEMDVGVAIGFPWVEGQRRKFIAAGLGHGLVNVWHSAENDWDYWKYLLTEAKLPGRSGFVAIEGKGANKSRLDYPRYISAAYVAGVKIHGFKMTDFSDLLKWPFYSVDSTTWQAHLRHGIPLGIDRAGWPTSKAKATPVWKGILPAKGTKAPMRLDILKASARSWIRAEQQLTEHWKLRGIDWEKECP